MLQIDKLKVACTWFLFFAFCHASAQGIEPTSSGLDEASVATFALEASAELDYERAMLGLQRGAWLLGFRNFLPRINADFGNDERLSLDAADSFNKTIGISLEMPLWDGGKLLVSRSLESLNLDSAERDFRRKAQALSDSAIDAYRSLIGATARLEIRRKSLESTIEQEKLLALEVTLGLAKPGDAVEAGIRVAELRLELSNSQIDVETASLELAGVLGLESLPSLLGNLSSDEPSFSLDAASLQAFAVLRSPELVEMRFAFDKKKKEAALQKASWLPTVGLKASAQANGGSLPFSKIAWSLGLTVAFSGPLLNSTYSLTGSKPSPRDTSAGTSVRAEALPEPSAMLNGRNAALAIALESRKLKSAESALGRNVEAAVKRYELLARKRDLAARAVILAESKLDLGKIQVQVGEKTRLELIEMQNELDAKNLVRVDAALALLKAQRELEKLVGLQPGGLSGFSLYLENP